MKFIKIITFFLSLTITTACGNSKDIDHIAAIVNNNVILDSDIKDKIKINRYNACKFDSYKSSYEQLYKQVLNQEVIDNLILQVIIQDDFKIHQQQIDQIISSIASFKNMTINQFYIYLNSIGINYKKYVLEIYQDILKKLICNYAIHQYDNIILHNDIENTAQKLSFINFNKQFKLTHIIINLPLQAPFTEFAASENLSKLIIHKRRLNQDLNSIIKTYYENNILPKIIINQIECIAWNNVPVIFDQYLEKAKKGDIIGPVPSYDGLHILEIKDIHIKECMYPVIRVKINDLISKDISNNIEIKRQLSNIKKDIETKKTTFTMIVKEKDKDFYSKNSGNSVKWINLDNFELSMQKSLLSLKKDQISIPIYTNTGWCLIKLIDIEKLSYSEAIYERAYSYLLHQKFNTILNLWITDLKSKSYIKIIH